MKIAAEGEGVGFKCPAPLEEVEEAGGDKGEKESERKKRNGFKSSTREQRAEIFSQRFSHREVRGEV